MPTATPVKPHTGGGGTYLYTSGAPTKIPHTNAKPQAGGGVSSLPRTGGGAGGGNPTSPLAPLALLAAVAIAAGKLLPRVFKR